MTNFKATVTRTSNGTIELRPDSGNIPDAVEMGSHVEVVVDVIETAKEIEARNTEARETKAARIEPTPIARGESEPDRKTPRARATR